VSAFERLNLSLRATPGIFASESLWYLAMASLVTLIFYVALRGVMASRRIAHTSPRWTQMLRESLLSLRSLLVFAIVGFVEVYIVVSGWTPMYWRIERYGWTWFVASIVLMVVMHDAYFYWTHRLMHHPRLFSAVHRTHHVSANPTPWAAYAFSVPEAFVQAGIGVLIPLTIPSHPLAFAIFMIWQITFNVFGHSGYEIFPRWFLRTWPGKLLNTPTHHAMHHETVRANFGLYFNVWDRLMGTNHPAYADRFERVTAPRQSTPLNQTSAAPSAART
jgi:Delta7-sterol 5-desaturase